MPNYVLWAKLWTVPMSMWIILLTMLCYLVTFPCNIAPDPVICREQWQVNESTIKRSFVVTQAIVFATWNGPVHVTQDVHDKSFWK